MARQVYYDPFGSRLQGYHAGMQDEMALQDNTRRARAQDFDYQNFKPLELQAAQRQESYNQFADPYLRRSLGLNEEAAQAGVFTQGLTARGLAGDVTGQYAPAYNYGQQYLGLPQTQPGPVQLDSVAERLNRDFLAQRGDAERDWAYRMGNFGLNERQQAESEYQWRHMSPTAQLYALIQSGAMRGVPGAAQNPGDFSPYAPPQAPTQMAGPQAPPYQFPVPPYLQQFQQYGLPANTGAPTPQVDALGRPDISSAAF